MPVTFRSPLLISATVKLNDALDEMSKLEEFVAEGAISSEKPVIRWGAYGMIAFAIHNVYNGLEDVMKTICTSVDGNLPGGDASHQAILDQMRAPLDGIRSEVLSRELYEQLKELKGFRHRVNHNYASSLVEERVLETLGRMRKALPAFVKSVQDLDHDLTEPQKEEDVDDPFPGGADGP